MNVVALGINLFQRRREPGTAEAKQAGGLGARVPGADEQFADPLETLQAPNRLHTIIASSKSDASFRSTASRRSRLPSATPSSVPKYRSTAPGSPPLLFHGE